MKTLNLLVALTLLWNIVVEAQEACGQQPLNLSFENIAGDDSRGKVPKHWRAGGQGYRISLDSTVAYAGERSLQIKRVGEGRFAAAIASFPTGQVRGKTVRLSGYIKTDRVADGTAGLFFRVAGPEGEVLAWPAMEETGPMGTTDWTEYVLEVEVDPDAEDTRFGVILRGSGEAWFDALRIKIDGEPFEQPTSEELEPTEAELEWLREHAVPFDTAEAIGVHTDIRPFLKMIGDSRLVGLGEATHGTSEFFKMKHRLTRLLAGEADFNVFAIEANLPEARALNQYVLTGEGDPGAALDGLYFWTWNTQEVLDLIEWMRAYNASGVGRIEFWGFDAQYAAVAMDSVRAFVERADPAYLPKLKEAYTIVGEAEEARRHARSQADLDDVNFEEWAEAAGAVLDHLRGSEEAYLSRRDSAEVAWAIQYARVVQQVALPYTEGGPSRDALMAENVAWILDRNPGARAVLWAHNEHIKRTGGVMGSHLATAYGPDYLAVGFTFHEGAYTAVGEDGLMAYDASISEPGSIAYALYRTTLPQLILDLKEAAFDDPASSWLTKRNAFRSIGARAQAYGFDPLVPAEAFDILIFFDETTPTHLLHSARSAGEEASSN